MAAGVGWAHGSVPKAVEWALTAAVAASTAGAIIWCVVPLWRLQHDPVLRRMGLTPWPVRQAPRERMTDEHHS